MAWHDPKVKPLKGSVLQVENHGEGLQKQSGGWVLTVFLLEVGLPGSW